MKKYNRGFTLIEVLIALVVAVIGILAMIQLSGAFLKTISESDQRTVATALAERQIETLRGFDRVDNCSASEICFSSMASGSLAGVSVASGQGVYTFDVEWDYVNQVVSGGVITAATSTANPFKTFREVTVIVSWNAPEAGSVALSSIIAGVDPNLSSLTVDGAVQIGGLTPEVNYNPGVAPDVIAIDVGDGKDKETTKPLPDVVSSDQSTEVKFETITYNTSGQVVQEDFVTVNCFCELDLSGATIRTPAHRKFISTTSGFDNRFGELVSGATGTKLTSVLGVSGQFDQSDLCDRCCANHHDSSNNTTGVTYKSGASAATASAALGDHAHYTFSVSGPNGARVITLSSTEAGDGDPYLEACRMQRIDGVFRVVPDWKAFEINAFPDSYLVTSAASGSLESYVDYVKDRVQYEMHTTVASLAVASWAIASPTISPTPELTLLEGNLEQLISRTLYLDDISHDTALLQYLRGLSASDVASQAWLEYVPFYEVNTTLLSTWQSASDAVASVSSQTIDNVEDDVANYYGVYSRGLVQPTTSSAGSTAITAIIKEDNTGILGNNYANPSEFKGQDNKVIPSPVELSGSLTVTVDTCGAGGCYISGLLTKNFGGNINDVETDVTVSVGAVSCTVTKLSNSLAEFECVVPSGFSGFITVTSAGSYYINGTGLASYTTPSSISAPDTSSSFTLEKQ